MQKSSRFRRLGERRFLPFFLTQFFGTGNDNVFKFAFSVLAIAAGFAGCGDRFSPGRTAPPEALQGRVLELRGDWR